ncbi:MAG: hypothetical protein COA78_37080 [Blastopirellula sp.]|nr:MAG: hypothetical protein COA78_37080 [Blastopirellula sp.]
MNINSKLREIITIWVVSGDDGFGGPVYAAPATMKARWSEGQQTFINESGDEATSQAIIHVERSIFLGDWIALGDHRCDASPNNLTDTSAKAYKVRGFTSVSNIRNSTMVRKAFI